MTQKTPENKTEQAPSLIEEAKLQKTATEKRVTFTPKKGGVTLLPNPNFPEE